MSLSLTPISEDNPLQTLIAESDNDPVSELMILKMVPVLHDTKIRSHVFSGTFNCNCAMRNTEKLAISSNALDNNSEVDGKRNATCT
jgi:hypothetical protein